MCTKLLVIGASSRSFAESAFRDGMIVSAIDLFGDRDLVAVCQHSTRLDSEAYPQEVLVAAARLPPGPWVYGGGFENHPQLIDRLAAVRRLAGNTGRQTVLVRDPDRLAGYAKRSGCHFPATSRTSVGLPGDGSYLLKPLARAGGFGVMPWQGELMPAGSIDVCWQQHVAGQVMSASLLLGPGRGELLGLCRQLVGYRWGSGSQFGFCGSIEQPFHLLADKLRNRVTGLANLLAEEIGLRGLIGIDFIMPRVGDGDMPVILEINPRPTASLELIERRVGHNLAARHLAACGLPLAGSSARQLVQREPVVWAKLVVMSHQPVVITATKDRLLDTKMAETRRAEEENWPLLADRPAWGSVIESRRPILTVFAAAGSPAVALRRLRSRAYLALAVLHGHQSDAPP